MMQYALPTFLNTVYFVKSVQLWIVFVPCSYQTWSNSKFYSKQLQKYIAYLFVYSNDYKNNCYSLKNYILCQNAKITASTLCAYYKIVVKMSFFLVSSSISISNSVALGGFWFLVNTRKHKVIVIIYFFQTFTNEQIPMVKEKERSRQRERECELLVTIGTKLTNMKISIRTNKKIVALCYGCACVKYQTNLKHLWNIHVIDCDNI